MIKSSGVGRRQGQAAVAGGTIDRMVEEMGLEAFESRLGYRFKDRARLAMALTHRSWVHEKEEGEHYERVEFLGDSVLGLVTSEWLFEQYPGVPEGLAQSPTVTGSPLQAPSLQISPSWQASGTTSPPSLHTVRVDPSRQAVKPGGQEHSPPSPQASPGGQSTAEPHSPQPSTSPPRQIWKVWLPWHLLSPGWHSPGQRSGSSG